MVEEREERQTFEARVRDFVFCRERRFRDDETEKVRALFCTAAYRDICTTSRTTWCLWSPRPPEGHADDLERLVPNTERGAASRVGFPDIRRIHVRSLISFTSLCRFAKTQEPLSVGVAAMRHHILVLVVHAVQQQLFHRHGPPRGAENLLLLLASKNSGKCPASLLF